MSSRDEITLPATRPRSRKSLGNIVATDQENMTADIGSLAGKKRDPIERPAKKSRSKSIGPGGLDALKATTGNRRKSLAAIPQPQPKSILKMTMPPLREIPAHISARKTSPRKPNPPQSDLLIDFSTGGPTVTGAESLPNPFEIQGSAAVNETRVTLRTEEEQQAAAREREEKERAELEKEVNSRREARRKSLANRRVSFAPEATLHTWDVVVEYQDSTVSSNATNSTRRASSASGDTAQQPQTPGTISSDPSEPPSTPPESEEDTITETPEQQRELHRKKRRRSSVIPPMNFNNPDDDGFSSSPLSDGSPGDAEEVLEDDGSLSNSDSDDDDEGTMMSIDGGETTDMSMQSSKSAISDSSGRLEEALRLAAEQAGTQGIDFDEHGNTETIEDEEVIASFAPFGKKPVLVSKSLQDQENINPFSPAFKAVVQQPDEDNSEEEMTMDMTHAMGGIIPAQEDEDELSMDVTRAFGGILSNEPSRTTDARAKSSATNRRQSTRRKSSGSNFSQDDDTMEFTIALGGIKPVHEEPDVEEDGDMTMEFTTVLGGVLPQNMPAAGSRRRASVAPTRKINSKQARESMDSSAEDDAMDMTVAIGGIMPSSTEDTINSDQTMDMDMTMAVGGIIKPPSIAIDRTKAKKLMELETDMGSSPFQPVVTTSPSAKVAVPVHTIASETGSPSMAAFNGRNLRRSNDARNSMNPKGRLSATPVKKPTTPSKQMTPQPNRPTTPEKTPPSKNVVMRTSSPKRLFGKEIKAASTPLSAKSKKATPNKLFQKDIKTGVSTPSFILTPQRRRSSGVGIDREGLGSPRIAAILDRRGSIGAQAQSFVPSSLGDLERGVRFDDPRIMEQEVDKEQKEEEDRGNKRKIMEREADQAEEDKDATLNLKEMIQSLTPKKKSLKGRKSLHVGAARGILGKRPVELDEDEDEEEINSGVKRLKNHQGSPVKNVKLPGPPSKEETTTGRLIRATRRSLEPSASDSTIIMKDSPFKEQLTTPHGQERFKDVEGSQEPVPFPEEKSTESIEADAEALSADERIQLQDFLNMTSIRFMELTTTKRRHTIAPPATSTKNSKAEGAASLQDCVAAGAAVIPMLELFQHACHELKNYISEGRKTVREIETETFEENPPLFREYISAAPDVKIIMDNQLKNVKTHARLLSKGMWYEWRMTLLATLKDGFHKTAEAMVKDEKMLSRQQKLLDSVIPQLLEQAKELSTEEEDLQAVAHELANCDQEELGEARQQLISVDADIEAKKQMIADLQKQLEGKEAAITAGIQKKEAWLNDINEAEKTREECRGWTSSEITALRAKVDAIEQEHGWTITGVSGTTTSMTYRKEIELVFDAASFQTSITSSKPLSNSRIDLWYIAGNREVNPVPLTAEKDFFLQNMRDHVRSLVQAETPVKNLLQAVSTGWDKTNTVQDDISLLATGCPTQITKTSDSSIMIKSMLLIAPLATKVEVAFHLTCESEEDGVNVKIDPSAIVVYGERFNEPKMKDFLSTRCGSSVGNMEGRFTWGAAVAELAEKLLARGKK